MIIAVSACIVSAVVVAITQAKKEKVEEHLNAAMDANMGLQEENRVLDTCLNTMESVLKEQGKIFYKKDDIEIKRLKESYGAIVSERDTYERLYIKQLHETKAYKEMLNSKKQGV